MMTIDTYIQQKNEEFLRLEIAYSNLYRAYMSGNVDSMKYQYESDWYGNGYDKAVYNSERS